MALTPAQMLAARNAVDAQLPALWSAVQTRQDAFFAANGRYWQGLRSASSLPVDGADAVHDIGNTVPGYQGSPWPAALLANMTKAAVEITQYVGPAGPGYVGTLSVVLNGNLWQRAQDSGAESYRTYNWTNMGPPT